MHKEDEAGFEWVWETAYPTELALMISEFNSGVPTQPWPLLPATEIPQIWREFTGTGTVGNIARLDELRDLVLRNVVRLYINTELAGHTGRNPEDVIEGEGIELEPFVSWAVDTESGAWRISDYGMDKLLGIAAKLRMAVTPGRKVMYMDAILNVTHQRSDLAAWFIEGGISTLNEMAG